MMKCSYSPSDVNILLKDISGVVEPLPTAERERRIQSGTHYCEMLPLEYSPSERYLSAYRFALDHFAQSTADATAILAEKLYQKKGRSLVVVSLARAGIPIGILIKRYLKAKYGIDVAHYSISIIRGKGIDENAVKYITNRHALQTIQFIDGWIGKGAILSQLKEALAAFPDIDTELGVVSDPANLTTLCGTHEDILIPSSCLNATITGLISRTFLRPDIIGPDDFHGAVYYSELQDKDLSNEYLAEIESRFAFDNRSIEERISSVGSPGIAVVHQIVEKYGVEDINFIKPGIGETTRVLLRRVPWKVLVNQRFEHSPELRHIYQLAEEKKVTVEKSAVDLRSYKACGIIKSLSDV